MKLKHFLTFITWLSTYLRFYYKIKLIPYIIYLCFVLKWGLICFKKKSILVWSYIFINKIQLFRSEDTSSKEESKNLLEKFLIYLSVPSVAQNIGLVMSDTSFLEPIFFNISLLYLCQGLQNNDICFLLFSFTKFLYSCWS